MRILVDTHLLLWATADSRRLTPLARRLITDPVNEVHYSAASLWEIAIKLALRRRDFEVDLPLLRESLGEMGLYELPVTGAHAQRVLTLPSVHKDPFDRLLVAQAEDEGLVLVTNDALLAGYGQSVKLVS